jgi:NhaA family Na+:H+ antiporter
MALLGRRVPNSLRVFLLALAIVDDIGPILVIAVGYSHGFHPIPFAVAILGVGVTFAMQRLGVRPVLAYWVAGLATWAALHESGIHPTIAGVALGLLTPVTPWVDPARLDHFLSWAKGAEPEPVQAPLERKPMPVRQRLARAAMESVSPQQRLEDALHPWSAFLILPLFALANAGVSVSLAYALDPITLAVIVGLTVGKPLGIFAFSWLAIRVGLARKPNDVSWAMLFAAGSLAGIGFTMSLFIANLGLEDAALQSAKIGILTASLLSGAIGMAMIWSFAARRRAEQSRMTAP